jgi:hypothetical protein
MVRGYRGILGGLRTTVESRSSIAVTLIELRELSPLVSYSVERTAIVRGRPYRRAVHLNDEVVAGCEVPSFDKSRVAVRLELRSIRPTTYQFACN